jgi:hypothetical protein
MSYKAEAADIVGVPIHSLLVRGCRSCGIIVRMTGGQIRSVANQLVGAAVRLFVGRTQGSQMGVGAVVGSALGKVAGVVLVALERWLDSRDTAIMLGRKVCHGDYNC